jgi:hypothetical protein
MAKLDKKELLSLIKLKADNADLYLARITQEKIEQVKEVIDNLKLQKGDDGLTPSAEEIIELIKPLIPKPVKGDNGHSFTDKQLLKLIKPLIPEIPTVVKGDNGKDYILTPQDIEDIAKFVKITPEEVSETTPEEVRDLLSDLEGEDRLDVSAIKGLEDKLNGLTKATGQANQTIGSRLSKLAQMKDVDLSFVTKNAEGKYVLASPIESIEAENVSVDDTNLVVVKETNLQDLVEGVDGALEKARGTGVSITYVSVATFGDTTFSQGRIVGEINSDEGYKAIDYPAVTDIPVSNLNSTSTWIYIDKNNTLQQQTSIPTRQDRTRKLFTKRIGVNTTTNLIVGFEYYNNPIGHYTNSIRDVYEFLLENGVPFKKDQVITGRTDNLGFDVSAGSLLEFGGTGDIYNPNIKPFDSSSNVSYNLLSRTEVVSSETNLVKFWDNNGAITALGSTTLVGHRLYRFSNGNFAIQYGQGNYANLSLAKAGVLTEEYVLNPALKDATFFGWWIIEDIATNTGNTGATITTEFKEYTIGIQGGTSSALAGCLLKGNNLSDLLDVEEARTNLGLDSFNISINYIDVEPFPYVANSAFKINSIDNPDTVTITILNNGVAYTLGDTIAQYDELTISVDSVGFINLNSQIV